MKRPRYAGRARPSYYPMGVDPHYPPMYPPPSFMPSSVEDLREMAELYTEIAEDLEKKAKEKKDKEAAPPKKSNFTGGEQFGLVVIYSLITGAIQYWAIASLVAPVLTK